MKHVFSILVAMCFAASTMAETVFTFTSDADLNQTKDDISVVIAQGNGGTAPTYKVSWNEEILPSDMRLYLGNTITISSDEALTNIQMVFAKSCASGKEYAGLSASTGALVSGGQAEDYSDWKVDSWTGSAKEVVFTLTGKGQRQIQRVVIDGEPIVINPEEEAQLPTEADLDKDFAYTEPTVVGVKDTTIIKKEYAFITNNILVHCSLGSILKESDTEGDEHPAYFNCNADEDLTFTATAPIQRVEIDGYIRKAFSASCDKGTLTSKANADFEIEDANVVVVSGIKSTSVTIHCDKQVRCYEVRVFFKEDITSIEENAALQDCRKVLRDGKLYIIRNGKTYSASGAAAE
jgi:hypothetical protein